MHAIPSSPIKFNCGTSMKNRFMLAPLTNQQSYKDGTLSDEEIHWLSKRAEGGFGIVMTAASHVQKNGQGFPGQLGIFSDNHLEGHKRLTHLLRQHGSVSVIQLFHGGMRAPKELIGETPVCPSANEKHGARALALDEVIDLRNDFIKAAIRAKDSGYDGVEIHGAHEYIICQFLSSITNKRIDAYGGSLENRARLLFEIVEGIRKSCGPTFLMGVRLSPERFGMDINEVKWVCQELIHKKIIDFLDISLWDYSKLPEEVNYQDKSLLSHFTALNYDTVKLTVAGKIRTGDDVKSLLNSGVDFVTVGRSAILHHDFPTKVIEDPTFKTIETPVSVNYLENEGLSSAFIKYMQRWEGFVSHD